MDRIGVPELKRRLLDEVSLLFRPNGSRWKAPILEVLQEFRRSSVQAVLFGGTLRSLLVSRIFQGKFGRPRDIDVVVSGIPLSALEDRFGDIIARRTRFGGLQLKHRDWQFDVWPVGETWAFRQHSNADPGFAELPSTTTFNLEAIAVEAWSVDGRPRQLFSGDDQFFEGILSRTLEINRGDSPFPELTVVRAVVMASELQFRIGPMLGNYIGRIGPCLDEAALERLQTTHYGYARINSRTLKQVIDTISLRSTGRTSFELPRMGQLRLWNPPLESARARLHIHCSRP